MPKILFRKRLNTSRFKVGDIIYLPGKKRPYRVEGYKDMGLQIRDTQSGRAYWLQGNQTVFTENLETGLI